MAFDIDEALANELQSALSVQNAIVTNVGIVTIKPAEQWSIEAKQRPTPKELWLSLWYEGAVCCLFADSNLGKSIYAVQIANEIAKREKVIYFDFELSDKQFQLRYTDENGNLYIADFCKNAIVKILPDGTVTKLCENGDTDGLHGELDQPGEPIIWNGRLIVSCFDTVTHEGVINTAHEMPATLAQIKL